MISIRLTTGYWCRISIARYWWRASRQDEFRRGRCEAVRKGTSTTYLAKYKAHLRTSTCCWTETSWCSPTRSLRSIITPSRIRGVQHTTKMFIPHIPVVSSSPLSPPGSLYPRSRQGKVAELRLELNSGGKKDKNNSAKKIALKKIVANMTMSNNDMVALFPDIVNCMQIPSLEIKKM